MLEGDLNFLEGGLLLLESALCLLTRAPLLAKLLLHRSERVGLLSQISTQPHSLLGLLLDLACQDCAPSRVMRSC
jgi:hypothetical protein